MINFYSELKEKYKGLITNSDYCNMLLESLMGMFVYTCESDKYLEKWLNHKLELWLRVYGKVGFAKDENGLYFGRVMFVGGKLNKYGWLDKVQIYTLDGGVSPVFDVDSDNVVIMFNNGLGHGEWNCLRYADKLTEIDKSMDCGILNSRYTQLVLVKNDKVKKNIDSAIKEMKNGEPLVVSGKDLLANDLIGNGTDSKGVEVFNITDVTNSDKLQYLTHFHDDLMRTFYQIYGIDTNSTGKMAQQSTEEIEGNVGRSFIIPNDNYNWRVKALNEIKEKFNFDITINWGESWGIELNKYKADVDDEGTLSEPLETEDNTTNDDDTTEPTEGANDSEGGKR